MVSVLVCISVVAAIIPAAFAEDELAADEPTSSTMTTFTLATTTTANSPTKNTSTIPPSCGLPSCHPADGENLCGSIAALRDECSFEKCYCDGYPDGKACPRYQEQCVDTLEKVDLTPAPTFMPISYGQDSSASATTSVLGAVVGALLVGVLIIFILRRKSKAEALEKAALFRQNQVCLFPLPSHFSFFLLLFRITRLVSCRACSTTCHCTCYINGKSTEGWHVMVSLSFFLLIFLWSMRTRGSEFSMKKKKPLLCQVLQRQSHLYPKKTPADSSTTLWNTIAPGSRSKSEKTGKSRSGRRRRTN